MTPRTAKYKIIFERQQTAVFVNAVDHVRKVDFADAARVVDLGALRHDMRAANAERLVADVGCRLLLKLFAAMKNVNEEAAERHSFFTKIRNCLVAYIITTITLQSDYRIAGAHLAFCSCSSTSSPLSTIAR